MVGGFGVTFKFTFWGALGGGFAEAPGSGASDGVAESGGGEAAGSGLGPGPGLELLEAQGHTELSPGALRITSALGATCRAKALAHPSGLGLAG